MTTAMTTTNGTTEQTAQRLQAAKDQIAKQRGAILNLQRQLQQIQGERRVLELREQRLRLNVRAAEQALTAAQEAASHAQAAALIDGPSDAGDVAAAAVASAQTQLQVTQEELDTALAPTGAIGAARADLQAHQAQLDQQLRDAQQLAKSIEQHAHAAHAANGAALVDQFASDYDAAIGRLHAAYAEAQAAREQLALIGRGAVATFGEVGHGSGSWQMSADGGMPQAAASEAMRTALEQRVPLAMGRAADIVSAFDTLMAALEQGAGRVPAQIGTHALRAVMQLDHSYFAQHWVFALLQNNSPTASKPFEILREQAQGLLAAAWSQAQPSSSASSASSSSSSSGSEAS